MINNPPVINLCIASEAVGGIYYDRHDRPHTDCRREDCPLELTEKQAKHCPCKIYEVVGEVEQNGRWHKVRVLACAYPLTWKGEPVRNPEALAAYLKRRITAPGNT